MWWKTSFFRQHNYWRSTSYAKCFATHVDLHDPCDFIRNYACLQSKLRQRFISSCLQGNLQLKRGRTINKHSKALSAKHGDQSITEAAVDAHWFLELCLLPSIIMHHYLLHSRSFFSIFSISANIGTIRRPQKNDANSLLSTFPDDSSTYYITRILVHRRYHCILLSII